MYTSALTHTDAHKCLHKTRENRYKRNHCFSCSLALPGALQVRTCASQPARSPHRVTLIGSGDVWPGLQRSRYLPHPLRHPSLGRMSNSLMSVSVLEVPAVLLCRARPKCRFTRRQLRGSYHRSYLATEVKDALKRWHPKVSAL